MLKKIVTFRDNIILFSLGCYGLGFVYMIAYYNSFNLPIIYYVSFNDLLLFALSFILPTSIIVLFVEILIIPVFRNVIDFAGKFLKLPKIRNYSLNAIIFLFTMLLIIVWVILRNSINADPKNEFLFLLTVAFLLNRRFRFRNKKSFLTNIGTFCLLFFIGITAVLSHNHLGKTNTQLKFRYNDNLIHTGLHNSLVYIGETSSFVFLYNFTSNTTSVFEKDKITNLKYSDKNERKGFKTLKLETFIKEKNIDKAADDSSKFYKWHNLKNKNELMWFAEQRPHGLKKILGTLYSILNENGLDKEISYFDNSYLPKDLKMEEDLKILNDSLLSGNYEIQKTWIHPDAWIALIMNKDGYYIRITLKDNSEYFASSGHSL